MKKLLIILPTLLALMFSSLGITPVHAAPNIITVNTAVDEVSNNGLCSLREAIVNANNNAVIYPDCATGFGIDTINFAGNYTITLVGSQLPAVTSPIAINGNGAANTIIQANTTPNAATYRVFGVQISGNLTLDSLTVRHGRCSPGVACEIRSGSGGGIINYGTLTVTNSVVSGNNASAGGGIYNDDGANLIVSNSTISGNNAGSGGGICTEDGSPLTITNSTLAGNSASLGGGIFIGQGSATITNSSFSENSASNGGAIYSSAGGITLDGSILSGNDATTRGGAIHNFGYMSLANTTLSGNSAGAEGGGIYNDGAGYDLNITFSTLSENNAGTDGGGVYNGPGTNLGIYNSTLYGNSAAMGGGIYSDGNLWLGNATVSGNEAYNYGGGIYSDGSTWIHNSTIVFNTLWEGIDDLGVGGINGEVALYNSIVAGNARVDVSGTEYQDCSGTISLWGINAFWDMTNCSTNPASPGYSTQLSSLNELGPLQDNGGPTWTHALLTIEGESRAIDAGDNSLCAAWPVNNVDQRGVTRPQGSRCDVGAYEAGGIKVILGYTELGAYALVPTESRRVSFPGVNNGPVQLINRNGQSLILAERVIYKVNGLNTSFTEMMGLPDTLLDTSYWLPWYNNVDLDTQLRFGNVSGSTATVRVYIGGVEMTGGCTSTPSLPYPYVLANGASLRVSCAGVNNGPVNIQSTGKIVAAERLIYKVNGINTSFSEMMGLPNGQLSTTYWLPWYNNVDLDTQLRFGNVGGAPATVRIYIGGTEMTSGCTSSPSLPYPYVLGSGASLRVSCAGVNNGPVKIVSNQSLVAAERLIYKVNGTNTSFTEMMGLPNGQLSTTYWLPWYNNVDLDTQLRFGVP